MKIPERGTARWLKLCVAYTGTLILSLFVFIIVYAAAGLIKTEGALFASVWHPEGNEFGLLPMISVTLQLAVSALCIGTFLSLGCIAYLHGGGSRVVSRALRTVIRLMTAVPTVVYGFASVFLLVPFIRDMLGGSGYSWLTATMVLGLLITPAMVISMDKAVDEIKRETSLACLALGLTPEQSFACVILPASRRWFAASVVLGFGRAVGDTLIPTMLAGNAPQFASHPLQAMRTLTAHIGLVLSADIGGTAYYSLFVAGGILLAASVSFNLIVLWVRGK